MRRLLAAGVALLFLAPAGLADAADRRVVLTGTTVLLGTSSAVVPVSIPRAVTFRQPQLSPDGGAVRVEGAGRFIGIALVEEGNRPDRTVIIGGRAGSAGATSFTSSALSSRHPGPAPVWTIPAGDYRLYLMTDGRPARVTLTLGGLRGTQVLRPNLTRPSHVASPANALLPQGLSSAGAEWTSRGPVLRFAWIRSDYDVLVAADTVRCSYYGSEPGENPFRPGCLGADQSSGFSVLNADADPVGVVGTSFGLDPRAGAHGQGYSMSSAGLRRGDTSYIATWLQL